MRKSRTFGSVRGTPCKGRIYSTMDKVTKVRRHIKREEWKSIRVRNNGSVPQYYVTDDHEAIIPRDLYMQVQEEMQRRSNLHSGKNRKKRVYSSKYALSSIVYCSKCGDIYRRIAWNNRGKRSNVWRCVTRVERGPDACEADTIQETEL